MSKIKCPQCFVKKGFLKPPPPSNEIKRCEVVKHYKNLPHWENKHLFKEVVSDLKNLFNTNGFSISLVDKKKVYYKFEKSLQLNEMMRSVSIDSHAILSKNYFLLLDTTTDWRTSKNPFVIGLPYIKFYCGVPLKTKLNHIIGVVAIFDFFSKKSFHERCFKTLNTISEKIMKIIDIPENQINTILNNEKNDIDDTNKKEILNELQVLSLNLGRATGKKSLFKCIYEKDGSGGPYSQNLNSKFDKFTESESEISENLQIYNNFFEKIFRLGSLKNISNILVKSIAKNFNVDYVYIIEIKIAEPCTINSKYFNFDENSVLLKNFSHENKLVMEKKAKKQFIHRVLGQYKKKDHQTHIDNKLHYDVFHSVSGKLYNNKSNNSLYNSGVIMPIHKFNSKIFKKNTSTKKDCVNLYLRNNGLILGLLNYKSDIHYDSKLISNIYKVSKFIRNAYKT